MENFFHYNTIAMHKAGFWPLPYTRTKEFVRKSICWSNIIMSIIVGSAELWEGFDNFDNTSIFTESIVVASTAFINLLKSVTFLMYRDYVVNTLNTFNDLNENTPVDIKNKKIVNNIEVWKKQAYKVTVTLVTFFAFPFLFYMAVPWIRFFKDNTRMYPFPSKYPFDESDFRVFFSFYMLEFVMAYVLIWSFISSASFFGTSVLYICSRMEILKYSLNAATEDAIKHGKTTLQFGKTIEYHKSLLKSCQMIEQIYSPCLLIQFGISTLLLCCICFLTTMDITVEKQLTFLSFFLSMLCQLFVYCHFGQTLKNNFEEFWYYAFHSSWYDAPISYQKDFKFLLLRCSMPVTLTAYKIMPVEMESFYSICKTSLSYLTMLQSMNTETK